MTGASQATPNSLCGERGVGAPMVLLPVTYMYMAKGVNIQYTADIPYIFSKHTVSAFLSRAQQTMLFSTNDRLVGGL